VLCGDLLPPPGYVALLSLLSLPSLAR